MVLHYSNFILLILSNYIFHVGGFGYDFSYTNDTENGVNAVAKGLLPHGVTSFCPTVVTSPKEIYHRVLKKIKKRRGNKQGASILGIHVEGPFINVEKKGAHPPQYIKHFDEVIILYIIINFLDCIPFQGFETVNEIYGTLDNVKIMTLAPELEHSCDVIKKLIADDIIVSLGKYILLYQRIYQEIMINIIGHSMANLKDGEVAVSCGATFITHLFNAMLPVSHI